MAAGVGTKMQFMQRLFVDDFNQFVGVFGLWERSKQSQGAGAGATGMVARRIASEEARQTMFPLPGIVAIAIE